MDCNAEPGARWLLYDNQVSLILGNIYILLMDKNEVKKAKVQLPKDALRRVNLGQSFAEYDRVLTPQVFVKTPAVEAVTQASRSKCFFVGRRGTGKTAITYYLGNLSKWAFQLHPQSIKPLNIPHNLDDLRDTRQRPFRSLVSCYRRALADEALSQWTKKGQASISTLPSALTRERNLIEDHDFDQRFIKLFDETFSALNAANEKEWLKQIARSKDICKSVEMFAETHHMQAMLLIDRIDEAWDGSDSAVIFLMALMHACVEQGSESEIIRPLLFLRENIFERVRQIDNEFSRLETCVVSLDWTKELLLELIERRLNAPFNTKLPLDGTTWDYFFEAVDGESSRSRVFNYCQERPRDVLTYCTFAVESAQGHLHQTVKIEDLQDARRRFSDSRLKDLGDEYSENYPQLQLVLSRFYGLGDAFTLSGIAAFVQKLLVDQDIQRYCGSWLNYFMAPERFMELFYAIGFWGIREGASVQYRSMGVKTSNPPKIASTSTAVIHPTFVDALNLQKAVIATLDNSLTLRTGGVIADLPEGITLATYQDRLHHLVATLDSVARGHKDSQKFEEIIGESIRLCFYRSLVNVEPRVRDAKGTVVRDWMASNVASSGFWEIIRQRYQAVQVIWECKNYDDLEAEDFHQASYYMSTPVGKFVIIVFRGDMKNHYYEHIKRIATDRNGLILLLTEKDVKVFLRQAINGKVKETHIQEIYDKTIRKIS